MSYTDDQILILKELADLEEAIDDANGEGKQFFLGSQVDKIRAAVLKLADAEIPEAWHPDGATPTYRGYLNWETWHFTNWLATNYWPRQEWVDRIKWDKIALSDLPKDMESVCLGKILNFDYETNDAFLSAAMSNYVKRVDWVEIAKTFADSPEG